MEKLKGAWGIYREIYKGVTNNKYLEYVSVIAVKKK